MKVFLQSDGTYLEEPTLILDGVSAADLPRQASHQPGERGVLTAVPEDHPDTEGYWQLSHTNNAGTEAWYYWEHPWAADGHVLTFDVKLDNVKSTGQEVVDWRVTARCPGEDVCRAPIMGERDGAKVRTGCAVQEEMNAVGGIDFIEDALDRSQLPSGWQTALPVEIKWRWEGHGEDAQIMWRPVDDAALLKNWSRVETYPPHVGETALLRRVFGEGLMFLANLLVLHPQGLALGVRVAAEPRKDAPNEHVKVAELFFGEPTALFMVETDDPEGIEFDADMLNLGMTKLGDEAIVSLLQRMEDVKARLQFEQHTRAQNRATEKGDDGEG